MLMINPLRAMSIDDLKTTSKKRGRIDDTRYFVESILDVTFEDPKSPKLGNCKILIKWSGYPEQWHYLLDVPDIRMTEALVQYVKSRPNLA